MNIFLVSGLSTVVAFYTSCIALFKPVFRDHVADLHVGQARMVMFVSVNDKEADIDYK